MIDLLVLKIGPIHESLLGVGIMSTRYYPPPTGTYCHACDTGKEAELREVKGVAQGHTLVGGSQGWKLSHCGAKAASVPLNHTDEQEEDLNPGRGGWGLCL